jgi:biotin carboxyl carrier protein
MQSHIRHMRITVEGKPYDVTVELLDEVPGRPVSVAPPAAGGEPVAAARAPASKAAAPAGAVPSPLSGVVVSIDVTVGQTVKPGELLVTLEAMKMKTHVNAPTGGKVTAIEAKVGAAVEEGSVLVVLG